MKGLERLLQEGIVWCAAKPLNPSFDAPVSLGATFGIEAIERELPQGGLCFGGIHEWYCIYERSNLLYAPHIIFSVLIRNSSKALRTFHRDPLFTQFIVWIGKSAWPAPFVLEKSLQFSFEKARINLVPCCIFIDPPDEKTKVWAIETSLSSPSVAVVVTEFRHISFSLSRKFSLAAKKGNSLGLFIRDVRYHHLHTCASSKWVVSAAPSESANPRWLIELTKVKGHAPQVTQWIMESSYDETISLFIPPALVGKYGAEETRRARVG